MATSVTGGEAVTVRRLTGGVSNRTYLVRLQPEPGRPPAVVVRLLAERDRARNEAVALRLLEGGVIPAPRYLWHGYIRGEGWAVVSTRIAGRLTARPRDPAWIDGLARVLRAIHLVPRSGRGLAIDRGADRSWLDEGPGGLGPLAELLWPALVRLRAELGTGSHVLVHGDFHPGNVHWLRGRVCGVID